MGEYLKAKAGNEIHYKVDRVEDPKAVVLINHGFAEHIGRYDYLREKLNENGYTVYRYDLRGHGKSGMEKGHIDSYREFIDDCKEMVALIKSKEDKEIFMLGHSMGGMVTLIYGIENPDTLKGQIFSGAGVGELPAAQGIKRTAVKLAAKILPKKMMENPVSDDICSDPAVVQAYKEDPLVLREASFNFYKEFTIEAIAYAQDNKSKYTYPCLITHGEEDKIVPKEISEDLYRTIASKDKDLIIYQGLYHEILNERTKDQVIMDMVSWLNKRI